MVAIGWVCLRGGYGLRVPGEVSFFAVAILESYVFHGSVFSGFGYDCKMKTNITKDVQ